MNQLTELRLYTWTLYQLSSIQQGIQAGHAAIELAMKTNRERGENPEAWQFYCHWGETWKTMICLNGGDLNELVELRNFFATAENSLPWAEFYEDSSLGGCLTSIAMIIPDRIFKTAEEIRKNRSAYGVAPDETFTPFEWELIKLLTNSSKAR